MAKLAFFAVFLFIAAFPSIPEGKGSLVETTTRTIPIGNILLGQNGDGNIPCHGFCLSDIRGCQPGCGCLIIPGICTGACCK